LNARGRKQRLHSIHEIADSLRQSSPAAAMPDLTGSILDAVDAERPFLSPKTRRVAFAARFVLGLALVSVVLGVAIVHRFAPGVVELTSSPAPLSAVVETVSSEATLKLANLRQTVETVSSTSSNASASKSSGGLLALVGSVAPKHPYTCTMIGPTLSPAEAARQGCPSAACAPFCMNRPLAEIGKLSGVALPAQSDWALRVSLGNASSPSFKSKLTDIMPLLADDEADAAFAPR